MGETTNHTASVTFPALYVKKYYASRWPQAIWYRRNGARQIEVFFPQANSPLRQAALQDKEEG
jgi:hypothetical protein